MKNLLKGDDLKKVSQMVSQLKRQNQGRQFNAKNKFNENLVKEKLLFEEYNQKSLEVIHSLKKD